jgi:hypothetical protein
VLRPGEYPARIIQVQVKASRRGNYEQHALRVRVEDAANEHWEDFWERLTFSDRAMWKVEQAMEAVGLNTHGECDVLPEDWVEKRCRVELGEKEGKMEIKRWIKGAVRRQPLPAMATMPARGRMGGVMPRSVGAVKEDDDLPF